MLVSFLGYRLAQSYGLSGLTGLGISSALYFFFVTDAWLQFYSWLVMGDNLLKALSGTVLISCAILLTEKAKFFALVTLVSLLTPVTATSVTLPQYTSALVRGEAAPPSALWERLPGLGQKVVPPVPKGVPPEAIRNDLVTLARISADSSLYVLKDQRFIRSSFKVEQESWVLVLSQIVGNNGQLWVNVMLPTSTGDFVLNDSVSGFVAHERITEQLALSAPK